MQTMQASVVGLLTCMQRFCVRLAARLFWQAAPGQGGAGPGDTDRPHPPHVSIHDSERHQQCNLNYAIEELSPTTNSISPSTARAHQP